MKFGVALGRLNPAYFVECTLVADRLGYESVWLPEHLVFTTQMSRSPHPGEEHPPVPPTTPIFDAFAYLAYLAGRAERVRLGTHVYNIGLRHPFVAARAVQTLDLVSGGRAEFGVGASWLEEEWDAAQLDFHTRGRRVDEALAVCQRLWTDAEVSHHGEFFSFDGVVFEPKPVQQPWPPIHVGGDGPAALRRAALVGDGWIPMNHPLDQIPPAVARLAELRETAGRPGKVEVTIGGSVASAVDVDRYAEAGVDRLIVRPWPRSKEAIDGIRRFADEVMSKL